MCNRINNNICDIKPHLYKVNGLWYCKCDESNYTYLGAGRNTYQEAFSFWMDYYSDRPIIRKYCLTIFGIAV